MNIAIHGVLRDAYLAVRRVNDAAVIVQIGVTEAGALFEAAVVFGDRPEDHVQAQRVVGTLRRGAAAVLTASDLRWVADHGRARFVAAGTWAVTVDGERVGPH